MVNKKVNSFGMSEEYPKEDGLYVIPLEDIPSEIKFHELTKKNPNYIGNEMYEALKISIDENGYDKNFPIFIYRNKIVDGFHRTSACKELGVDKIYAKEIPYTTSMEDVEALVLRLEKRRQMTKTQIAIKAWKEWKNGTYKSRKEASLKTGISENSLKAVDFVAKRGDIKWIDILFNGGSVKFDYNKAPTDSIFTLKSYIYSKDKDEAKKDTNQQTRKASDSEIKDLKEQLVDIIKTRGWTYKDLQALSYELNMSVMKALDSKL